LGRNLVAFGIQEEQVDDLEEGHSFQFDCSQVIDWVVICSSLTLYEDLAQHYYLPCIQLGYNFLGYIDNLVKADVVNIIDLITFGLFVSSLLKL